MTNWTTSGITIGAPPPDVSPITGYVPATGYNLSYATSVSIGSPPAGVYPITNYRLAFSTGTRSTSGQIWPRGALNRV